MLYWTSHLAALVHKGSPPASRALWLQALSSSSIVVLSSPVLWSPCSREVAFRIYLCAVCCCSHRCAVNPSASLGHKPGHATLHTVTRALPSASITRGHYRGDKDRHGEVPGERSWAPAWALCSALGREQPVSVAPSLVVIFHFPLRKCNPGKEFPLTIFFFPFFFV